MRAYLVQHASAKSEQEDPERPITDAGADTVRRVAHYALNTKRIEVARIWHSGKTRAAQTAELLAEYLAPSLGVREAEGLNPDDDPAIWAERLNGMEQDGVIVGHLPHLSRLASLLLCGDPELGIIDFQNAGVVCLARRDKLWSIRWVLTPDLIRA